MRLKRKKQNTYSLKFRVLYGLAFAQAFWGIVIGLTEKMAEQVMFCILMAVIVIAIVMVTDVEKEVAK